MIEVELRAKVANLNALEEKVKALGAKYAYSMLNIDEYYLTAADAAEFEKNPTAAATPKGGVVRIRTLSREGKEGKSTLLTIKTVKGGDLAVRQELQVHTSDARETQRILEYFGCKKILTLTKNRKIYNLGEVGILLDDINELGAWVEVSIEGAHVDAEPARAELLRTLEKMGFAKSEAESKGYYNLAAEKLV